LRHVRDFPPYHLLKRARTGQQSLVIALFFIIRSLKVQYWQLLNFFNWFWKIYGEKIWNMWKLILSRLYNEFKSVVRFHMASLDRLVQEVVGRRKCLNYCFMWIRKYKKKKRHFQSPQIWKLIWFHYVILCYGGSGFWILFLIHLMQSIVILLQNNNS